MKGRKIFRAVAVSLVLMVLFACCGCSGLRKERYSSSFFDTFDTLVTVYGYTKDATEFNEYMGLAHSRFIELHETFDIYNDYEGVNNIKTINDKAGIEPVKVRSEIIGLLKEAKRLYAETGGRVNIAMGSVLRVWHDYREAGLADPELAELPSYDRLQEAGRHTDLDKVIIDEQTGTVYIEDALLRLDVGAIAKGYACQLVKQELTDAGFESFVISAGGNVCTAGEPAEEGQTAWLVGIQNPDTQAAAEIVDTLEVRDKSVVTAGGYQRYYTVNGERYHHIIDKDTYMPANYYESVTVIGDDSGVADFLSTTLFLMPLDEGKALAKEMNVDAMWIFRDGSFDNTDGYRQYSAYYMASN